MTAPSTAKASAGPPSAGPRGRDLRLRGRTLRQHAARGVVVNGLYLVALHGLQLGRGLVLVALLTPRDFGLWGLILVVGAGLGMVKQATLSDAFLRQDEADQELAFRRAFTLECLVNAGLAAVFALLVLAMALAQGRPELLGPAAVYAIVFPALTLQAPFWVLARRLEFGRWRRLQAVDPVVGTLAAIAIAAAGGGVWALVGGVAVGAAAGAAVAVRSSPYPLRPTRDRPGLRPYLTFSGPLLAGGVMTAGVAIGTMVVTEAAVGLAAAGAVALMTSLSAITEKADTAISSTLYPVICAAADRTDVLRETLMKSNRVALMWAVPYGTALVLFAEPLVRDVIGARWALAIPLIHASGVVTVLGHVAFNWPQYAMVRGETRVLAVNAAIYLAVFALVMVPLIVTSGLAGLAIGLTVATVASLVWRTIVLRRLFGRLGLGRHALRAALPVVPAVAAVLGLRAAGAPLAVELVAFGALVVVATGLLERRLIGEVVGYLRGRGVPPIAESASLPVVS